MRIHCPYCGERDAREFTYLGDAKLTRPDPQSVDALNSFFKYVYLRENPAGLHSEYWYHGSGCQTWLVVTRDTRTHEISKVRAAVMPFATGDT